MNFSNFYLKAAQEKTGANSYEALLPIIGGSSATLTKIRKETGTLTKAQVTEIAKILSIDECIIAAAMQHDKAKTKQEKSLWTQLIKGYKNAPNNLAFELFLSSHNSTLSKIKKIFKIRSTVAPFNTLKSNLSVVKDNNPCF